ncbi:hypothetical protein LOOC260_101450 [Paucilactobacillus hokkaidonensis JCM 18461]|uniref:Uroporphyrin-III C-methyltransferase n=2 Tax=Paucilactobacillus hokkaidonensis TaxID=1193095 RepID=A0A0A1GV66_9LACO|nr:DUF488 family protein [Paucilactobacillus hokkaidonensis]KRO09835.1 hypothetical protein IV59_GL000303 [Paucilactobacillus hokkaidonensis]BAP84723.1 hypothetical protein LOOC260_101450 [Paucilactobacillus hokkaidonensis JCM 18461]
MQIKIERIYTKPIDTNGYRILVDRLWPRGISKVNAKLDQWYKEIGPSNDLRKWFNHEVEKYPEFKQRYIQELQQNHDFSKFQQIVSDHLKTENVIFLFGAKDEEHNQAVVLREYLLNTLD